MKTIVRGAIVPALIVAALQCVMIPVFAIASFEQSYKQVLSMMYVELALSQMMVLIGAAAYAGFLRRRSRASLSGCAVGGAAVGLMANLASHVAMSILLCLGVAVMVSGVTWTGLLVPMFTFFLFTGITGLVVGEVGGGVVGLLFLRRQRTSSSPVTRKWHA